MKDIDRPPIPSWIIILYPLVIFLLYSNTLHSPFILDDSQIIDNYFFRINELSLDNIQNIIIQGFSKNRWIPNISFALNYYFGASDVLGFHLVNIIIHVCVTFVFYLLALETLKLPSLSFQINKKTEIAFAAALLWAVHPLQTNAVTYIVQRMTSMATLFFLLSLLCYIKGRISKNKTIKITLFAATAILGAMALFSKENSGMLPIMILGYELFFLPKKEKNKKKLLAISGGALVVFVLICWLFLGNDPLARVLSGYGAREFTLGQRLLTETRIVVHYLSLLILPLPGRMNLAYNYQLSTGLFSPPGTLLAIVLLGGLTGLIFFLYKKNRLTAFAIFWFLANLAVESSIIPLELIFEHRIYLPSMFLVLTGVAWFYKLMANRKITARLMLVSMMMMLSILTWQRNSVWKNEITLWTDVVNKAPESIRGNGNLGKAYLADNKYDSAKEYLDKAIAIGHKDQSGNFAFSTRKKQLALVYDNLAVTQRKTGNYQAAIKNALQALKLDPERHDSLVTLGITYSKLGKDREAIEYFSKASLKGLHSIDLYNNWGISCYKLGMLDKAVMLFKRAVELRPDHAESHYNLGIAYSSKGMLKEAQREMSLGIQLSNKNK